jgi:hypothetical protein
MAKIYFYRHQAEGVIYSMPFREPPTNEQKQALDRLMFQKHGAHHPKEKLKEAGDRVEYFTSVMEFEVLEPSSTIEVPERNLSTVNQAEMREPRISASVSVHPKE